MQMRTFLLRALVLLLIAMATESVRSDEEVPQVSELPEESHEVAAHAKAAAPGDGETPAKEDSLVQFGTGLGLGDALGLNPPPPPPKMPAPVKAYMPLEAEPGEVMPPVAPAPPTPTPHPTEVWEDTPLPNPITMDLMPSGWIPGESMPPPVLASEEHEFAKGSSKKVSMPPPEEQDTLLEDTLTGPTESMPPQTNDAAKRSVHRKQKQAKLLPPHVRDNNIWDINMEDEHPGWEPESQIVARMPKVPVHKHATKRAAKQNQPLVLARKFGRHLQVFFQHIYRSAHGVVWGEWSPEWAKYRSAIFSVLFALTVAIAPVLVLLFVTLGRFLSSKLHFKGVNLKGKQADSTRDAEKGEAVDSVQSDALFYTSRMFPVD